MEFPRAPVSTEVMDARTTLGEAKGAHWVEKRALAVQRGFVERPRKPAPEEVL